MRKHALSDALVRHINHYLIYREVVKIKVTKLYSRRQMIPVDSNESWREYIVAERFI